MKMGLKANLLFSTKKNREIDDAKKSQVGERSLNAKSQV